MGVLKIPEHELLGLEENIVQWVLLNDQEYFAKLLSLPLQHCLGTEVTTEHGRVDFMFHLIENELLVIELETGITNSAKLEHCTSQLTRYQKLCTNSNNHPKKIQVALVYASDITPDRFQKLLEEFASRKGIILKGYSIRNIMIRYHKLVNQLCYTSGVSLGRAVALGVPTITWLKKFIIPFLILNSNKDLIDQLPWSKLKKLYASSTNFYVLKRLAEDFELIALNTSRKIKLVKLTEYGRRFRDEMFLQSQFQNQDSSTSKSSVEMKGLTSNQKRLLLEILVNGNLTKIKVNIFHFLRFVHITEGSWLPKQSTKLSTAELQYLNNLFKSSYNARTLKDLILYTCTFCEELELVKKLPTKEQLFDHVMFTSLGSRVYNYFEQLLLIERERHQIPMQMVL